MKDLLLYKIFKLKTGAILVGSEHKEKNLKNTWGWIGRKPGLSVYSMLYNRKDGRYIHQFVNGYLLGTKNTPIANIKEVSGQFLKEIIRYEFEKRGPGFYE